jgi:hypothetical protein
VASDAPKAVSIAARRAAASTRSPRSRWGSSRPAAEDGAAGSGLEPSGSGAAADAAADAEIRVMM